MSDTKLCKDCKFVSPVRWWSPAYWFVDRHFRLCTHPQLSIRARVSGQPDSMDYCSVYREFEHRCGVEAKFWEARS